MKLGLAAGLVVSSTISWAYQPHVYLLPTQGILTGRYLPPSDPLLLDLPQANKVLANHLGLDMYESLEDYGESKEWHRLLKDDSTAFWREYHSTPRSTVLLVVHTDRPEDLISASSRDPLPDQPSFYINATLLSHDISALISTYVAHAQGNFDTISSGLKWYLDSKVKFSTDKFEEQLGPFQGPSKAAKLFTDEFMARELYSQGPWDENTKFPLVHGDPALYKPSDFAVFEVTSLDLIAEEFGRDSQEYQKATKQIREWMNVVSWNGEDVQAVIIKPRTEPQVHAHQGRSVVARASVPGNAPIYSCFESASTCSNATGSCSGHGSCVAVARAGRTCYTCRCGSTKSEDGTSTTFWAGQRCERKDVSSTFVLLTGTVIGILVVAFGSVALLYGVGDEQLPGTLTGGAVPVSKHD